VSPCLFKTYGPAATRGIAGVGHVGTAEYFSLLRCYDENWKKGDEAMTVELFFDAKDGPVDIAKTASSVLNAIRFSTGWSDDSAWVMATWLSEQKKIIKRAQKKLINATGLGEFETLRVNGFYRPEALAKRAGARGYHQYGVVKTGGKDWRHVDTATVSNPNGDIGILFACGNNLFLFVEDNQTWVLRRSLTAQGYWTHGNHRDSSEWSKIDPEDGWAEHRIAKAINVFFESKTK
jgi:hypothetical protein